MNARRGMTLVELLVGLTLGATLAGSGYSALAIILDRRAALARDARATTRAAAMRRTIIAWLAGIQLVPDASSQSFALVDRTLRGRPDDELSFVTTARTPLGGEGALVTLRVEHTGPARGLVAVLQDRGTGRLLRLTLDSTVTTLAAWCHSGMLAGTTRLSSWISPVILPRGVEVQFGGDGGALDPLLRLPIVVPFPGGR